MRLLFSILAFSILNYVSYAQHKPTQIEIPSELFGVNQGLSQGYVSSIIQDKEGFMWFATNDGLNKYDGYKVSVYRNNPNDSFSLPDNMISGIAEDKHENFWVATRNKGLFLFDKKKERFFPVSIINSKAPNGIHFMKFRDGKMFLITYNNVLLIEVAHAKLSLPLSTTTNDMRILFDGSQQHCGIDFNIVTGASTKATWTGGNRIWGSNPDKIICFQADTDFNNWQTKEYNPKDFGIPYDKIEALYLAQNPNTENELICLGHNRLSITNLLTKKRLLQIELPNAHNEPIALADGNVLINARANKQYIVDCKKHQLIPCSFKNIDFKLVIITTYRDAHGVVWYATNGYGVIQSDTKKSNFDTKDVRYYGMVFKAEDTPRVHCFSEELKEATKQYFGLNNITEDKKGTYWIYANRGISSFNQLLSYPSVTNLVKRFKTLLFADGNNYIYNDRLDRLWFYDDRFLYLLDKDNGEVIRKYQIPEPNITKGIEFVRGFHSDEQGVLYMATGNGLFRFNPGAADSHLMWRKYQHQEGDSSSLVSNSLWCVCPDPVYPKKYLWLGTTSNGFSRLEMATGKCIHYSEKDGLPNNVVYGILTDTFNNLWLSTNKGLSCFNPTTKSFQNFVAEDGLQGDEFNHFDFMKLKTGELYFGGVNGYTIFKPEVVLQKQKEIPIVFTELSIANKIIDWKQHPEILDAPITYAKKIVFQPKQNMMTISFATLEYRSNKKKFYKYKLHGLFDEWTEPSVKNEATFSNLSPGTYTLEVTGTNTDGVWNSKGISIEIKVLPDWYQTWWFRTLVGLFLTLVIYLFYRYRLQQQLKFHKMRNRIAADLHDEIGSTLSSISIYSEAAKKITDGNKATVKVLNKISQNSTQVMETMSNIVWAINSSNDKIDNLINRIRIYAVQLSESAYFELHLAENEHIPDFKLDMYQRKHVYLLFKEAINNIAKYAQCENVWIEFESSKNIFVMRIKDDGIGFDPTTSNEKISLGGNGLFNMRKRASDLGGTLTIDSGIGKGTLIELSLKT